MIDNELIELILRGALLLICAIASNLIVLDLLYCGFFGEGNNVNNARLLDMGFWPNGYPTSRKLTLDEFRAILREGNVDVSNAIID